MQEIVFGAASRGEFRFCQTSSILATKPLEIYRCIRIIVSSDKNPKARTRLQEAHGTPAQFMTTLARANLLIHASFARETVETALSALISAGAI